MVGVAAQQADLADNVQHGLHQISNLVRLQEAQEGIPCNRALVSIRTETHAGAAAPCSHSLTH